MSLQDGSQLGSDFASNTGIDMTKFESVLEQVKLNNVPALGSAVRQQALIQNSLLYPDSTATINALPLRCQIVGKPLTGCYHINFRLRFEDGVEWIIKIPANGHPRCFDFLAAQALRSEALTMRMLKRETSIPVPSVHAFDNSTENDIGCLYILMDFMKGKSLDRVWFGQDCSPAKIERIRARSLQTIAAAIIQLSRYNFSQGGALRFDSDDQTVIGVGGAKVADNLALHICFNNVRKGLVEPDDDDIFCEKGPFTDPESAVLFMQNRRKPEDRRSIYNKGVDVSIRHFTEWIRTQLPGTRPAICSCTS